MKSFSAESELRSDTIRYTADYFQEFSPVSARDMLNRIPGIELVLDSEQVQRSNRNNNRGLGASDEILVDGKRIVGKENDAVNQLDRINAGQVDYIEIIRGSSSELDVRNTGQLVNIVLKELPRSFNINSEIGLVAFHDDTIKPTGSISLARQSGSLSVLVSAEIDTGYEALESNELSLLPDLSYNETRSFLRIRDETRYRYNTNVTYEPDERNRFTLNGLFENTKPQVNLTRTITDLKHPVFPVTLEREFIPAVSRKWELGGDYEKRFRSGDRFKILFITNEKQDTTTRERFIVESMPDRSVKDLFLDTRISYAERIGRTSYIWKANEKQSLEVGLERAETTQNSRLKLGLNIPGSPSSEWGGLTPVNVENADSIVQEIRFEYFLVHNYEISDGMTLESSITYEESRLSQIADSQQRRKFHFLKPDIDFRRIINRDLQLHMSVEKDVSQLSFADFSASTNDRDEDQNTIAGNPELVQEEIWRFNAGLDYRLPEDGGVLNGNFFYFDIENAIGKIDSSPDSSTIRSANGNVGNGKVFGIDLNASLRLRMFSVPNAILTAGIVVQDSEIYDSLIERERRIVPFDRGSFRIGFRHDLNFRNVSYGFNYRDGIDGNRPLWDIDNVIYIGSTSFLNAFVEMTNTANINFRFEANNLLNHSSCRERHRYTGYLRSGALSEIEKYCTQVGTNFAFKVRGSF